MKFALANAQKTMKDKVAISFFFNVRGGDIEKSTFGTYRSLLVQLLERFPTLSTGLDLPGLPSAPGTTAEHQWSIEPPKLFLEHVINSLEGRSVICFIDALDECEEWQVRGMISFFERVTSSAAHFQVCLSSRHYPHITVRKALELVLESQEEHTRDISNYLETELRIGQSRVAQRVRAELQEKASGVFMWVVIVVKI